MSNSILRLLVHAKQLNKWIPKSVLTMHNISLRTIHHLEDGGYLLVYHSSDSGTLIKLTLKGYKHFQIKNNTLIYQTKYREEDLEN